MKKVALHNLGCKVNGYEIDVMQQRLEEKGYKIVPFDENMYKDIEKLPCNLKGAICVMPNENYEGFFAVKLRKK